MGLHRSPKPATGCGQACAEMLTCKHTQFSVHVRATAGIRPSWSEKAGTLRGLHLEATLALLDSFQPLSTFWRRIFHDDITQA